MMPCPRRFWRHISTGLGEAATAAPLVLMLAGAVTAQTPSFEAVAAQAAAAREAGRLDEAVRLYAQGLSLKGDWQEGLWYLGTTLFELSRYAEARTAFTTVLSSQPAHAGAFGMRGLCAFHLAEYEDALRDLLRARALGIAQTPDLAAPVRYHLGILLTRFAEFEVGYAVLTEFATEGKDSPAVLNALGLNLLRKQLLPSEIPSGDESLVDLAGRAAFAMAARQAAEAERMLDELVSRYPRVPNVHYARGVFRLASSPDLALADFKTELIVSPAHVPAQLQIAFELLRRGEVGEAKPFAEEAVRTDPHHFAARLALGQAYFEVGALPEAIGEFETAVKLAPESAQAHFVLARAYARAGRTADADRERAEFKRLEELARTKPVDVRSLVAVPGGLHPPSQ